MRAGGIAKVFGHVVLSVLLTVLIYAAIFGSLFSFAGDSISSAESPAVLTASIIALYLTIGALVAQWHRRASIGRRLRSFVNVCAVGTPFALAAQLLQLPYNDSFYIMPIGGLAAFITSLVTLGTIEFPWPIPIARLWRGEIGLARTYWVWIGLVVGSIIMMLNFILQLFYEFTGSFFIIALRVAIGLIVSIFTLVSMWRSAEIYKGPRRWRVLARTACVIFGIFAIVNLGGLLGEVPFFKTMAAGDQTSLSAMFRSFFGF